VLPTRESCSSDKKNTGEDVLFRQKNTGEGVGNGHREGTEDSEGKARL